MKCKKCGFSYEHITKDQYKGYEKLYESLLEENKGELPIIFCCETFHIYSECACQGLPIIVEYCEKCENPFYTEKYYKEEIGSLNELNEKVGNTYEI